MRVLFIVLLFLLYSVNVVDVTTIEDEAMKRKLLDVSVDSIDSSEGVGDGRPPKKVAKKMAKNDDFFEKHICFDADEEFIKELETKLQLKNKEIIELSEFSNCRCLISWRNTQKCFLEPDEHLDLRRFGVSSKLCSNYEALMLKNANAQKAWYSAALYQIIGRYMDLCFVMRDNFYTELLCLHALNHVTRTRKLVIQNKQALEAAKEKSVVDDELIEKCRDQGLARPKVLILCPFRKHAAKIVETFIKIMFGTEDRPFVSNLAKFRKEYYDEENCVHEKRKVADDYRQLMSGNVDDCFRIGIGLAKKCLKLYTSFDESDVLLCSPVGLRMIIGEDEEGAKREFDFLSAIELVIIDKANILYMQNWEHLVGVFETLNATPTRITTDISRVRHWSLRGFSRYYRQTLLFAEINFVEMHALMARYCQNYAGEVSIVVNPSSRLPEIHMPFVQGAFRVPCDDPQAHTDARFRFFVEKVLPKCEPHTLIFIPSYYDFVRVRNYMKRNNDDFTQCHEYAKKGKVAKARHMFVNGQRKLLLLTERFHFYFRYQIKGIKSMVFYQLPTNPTFYTELVDFSRFYAEKTGDTGFRVETRMLFSKFDLLRLQNVFGIPTAKHLLNAEESCFAIYGE